jgi:hypothetical protein
MIESDLNEYVEGDAWPSATNEGIPVPPSSQEAAERVLHRVRRLTGEKAEVDEVAAAQTDRIQSWRADRVTGIERDIAWGEKALELFWRSTATHHQRSVSLPDGRLKLTKTRFRTVVTDFAAFASWAFNMAENEDGDLVITVKAHARELVRTDVKPNLAALSKLKVTDEDSLGADLALPGGEMVPGIECVRDEAYTFGIDLTD